ncbi:hypothetical protein [Dactylosporangium sp. NPDC051541]|uniref:hypothetical protein n=1 Tax=Dactylosporangium sp. NPDC051541 TaxID=3363977 RepID=UPI0037AD36BD
MAEDQSTSSFWISVLLVALLTEHPSRGLGPADRLKAVNNVRAPLVTFVAAAGAAITVWLTARTYLLSREGQVTDRYTKAIEQLGEPLFRSGSPRR